MNEKLDIDVKTLKPFTKFIYTIGELPTSYLVSMTYEEQLIWLCNYLTKTVIPTINNNGEAVKEVQDLVLKLQEYMNNYFDNLDVQREINKKLDEMAEDGTLTSLISNYVQPLIDEQNNKINTSINEQNNRIDGLNNVVTSVASGSPAGVYETLTALTNANPDHSRIYVVTSTNHWYYYNTTSNEWTDGGLYLSNQTPLTNKIETDVEINRDLLTNTETSQRLILEVEDFMNNYGLVAKGGASTWSTNAGSWAIGAISTSQILKENVIKFNSSESAFEFLQSGNYQIIVSGRFNDTASATTSVSVAVGIAIKTSSGTSSSTTDTNIYNSWQDNNYRLTGYFNRIMYIEAGTKIKPKIFSQTNNTFKECIIQIIRLK